MLLIGPIVQTPEGKFQWAPTLGGECYAAPAADFRSERVRFNGHPPLGVNATETSRVPKDLAVKGFNGHPPLGVNATV